MGGHRSKSSLAPCSNRRRGTGRFDDGCLLFDAFRFLRCSLASNEVVQAKQHRTKRQCRPARRAKRWAERANDGALHEAWKDH